MRPSRMLGTSLCFVALLATGGGGMKSGASPFSSPQSSPAPSATPPFVACGPHRASSMSVAVQDVRGGKGGVPEPRPTLIYARGQLQCRRPELDDPSQHDLLLRTGCARNRLGPVRTDRAVERRHVCRCAGSDPRWPEPERRTRSRSTGRASQVKYLEIRHFVSPLDQGVVNHDAGTNWTMAYNYMHDNGGAAMILGDNNTAHHNCLDRNAQYGFQIFGNTVNVSYNEISNNDSANVESSNPGCGCSGGMKAWGAQNVVLDYNWVHNNMNVGLWVDTNNVGFDISNNVITDNTAEAIIYETSYNFHITNNYIARNDWVQGRRTRGFPTRPSTSRSQVATPASGARTRPPRSHTTRSSTTGVASPCGKTPTVTAPAPAATTCAHSSTRTRDLENLRVHEAREEAVHRRLPLEDEERVCPRQLVQPDGSEGPELHDGKRLRRRRSDLPVGRLSEKVLARRPVPRRCRHGQHHVPPEQPLLTQHLQGSVAVRDPRTEQRNRVVLNLEGVALQAGRRRCLDAIEHCRAPATATFADQRRKTKAQSGSPAELSTPLPPWAPPELYVAVAPFVAVGVAGYWVPVSGSIHRAT